VIGRTPFNLENLAHRRRAGGIRTQPVDGLGWKYDQLAGAQGFDRGFNLCLCSSYHSLMISRLRCEQRRFGFKTAVLQLLAEL
jgi:hypothetical protein